MTQQKSQLHKTLWDIANTLRGNMGADEFGDYILGFILTANQVNNKTFSYIIVTTTFCQSITIAGTKGRK